MNKAAANTFDPARPGCGGAQAIRGVTAVQSDRRA